MKVKTSPWHEYAFLGIESIQRTDRFGRQVKPAERTTSPGSDGTTIHAYFRKRLEAQKLRYLRFHFSRPALSLSCSSHLGG
jgi:hypothetical protein